MFYVIPFIAYILIYRIFPSHNSLSRLLGQLNLMFLLSLIIEYKTANSLFFTEQHPISGLTEFPPPLRGLVMPNLTIIIEFSTEIIIRHFA
jgi:hypothetical protein